jgi:hypothetical protein
MQANNDTKLRRTLNKGLTIKTAQQNGEKYLNRLIQNALKGDSTLLISSSDKCLPQFKVGLLYPTDTAIRELNPLK